ncbi:MAG TPA: DUF1015 domain-containing protein [Candidatus Acidoferrales bacterium]|nr:DUF1015 domain-containing protein [Candidatus Acidoferrales bacterium]
MAKIFPFRPYRYATSAGPLQNLVTQPYDKISPAMRARYLALSPNNLVRVILGERHPGDTDNDNVYTRAASIMNHWIVSGVWLRDAEPGMFAYFQEFVVPDTGERLVRKGFIALGEVVEYSAGIVYRHEQTLSGPKADRIELLRHTNTHFEPIFMLYPDPAGAIDTLLDEAAAATPVAEVADEYGAIHRMWRLGPGARIRELMADKKLIIADGHHRYETAVACGSDRMMMAFVNMHSPGLRILATHRLVSGIETNGFLEAAAHDFDVAEIATLDALKQAWASAGDRTIIGAAIGESLFQLEDRFARGALDVRVLHDRLLGGALGINEAAVRDEKHIRYVRGIDAAVEEARKGAAQVAFLLKPTSMEQVAKISFSGGVMPQKSTDFYPKLLSGMVMYQPE